VRKLTSDTAEKNVFMKGPVLIYTQCRLTSSPPVLR